MIVHRKSIIDILPEESEWSTIESHTSDWGDWGPPNWHWLDVPQARSQYITVTNGQRYVKCHQPGNSLVILDFNEYNVKHALANRNPAVCSASEREYPLFAEKVACGLPYLKITTQVDDEYDDLMINDNAIVGIRVRSQVCLFLLEMILMKNV